MNKKKEYAKEYWQREDVKEKKKLSERALYGTEKKQEYEHGRRRTVTSRYGRSRYNAGKRSKSFTITLEQYEEIVSRPCYYCEASIATETGSSMDRCDNSRGYEIDNVVTCCKSCNRRRAKSMDSETFKEQFKLNQNKKV